MQGLNLTNAEDCMNGPLRPTCLSIIVVKDEKVEREDFRVRSLTDESLKGLCLQVAEMEYEAARTHETRVSGRISLFSGSP